MIFFVYIWNFDSNIPQDVLVRYQNHCNMWWKLSYLFRWKKIMTKSHGTKKSRWLMKRFQTSLIIVFVNMYLEKRWHTDLEPSPSWYEWKMKEKQLIKASWSDFVICSIHVNVTSSSSSSSSSTCVLSERWDLGGNKDLTRRTLTNTVTLRKPSAPS